MSLEPDAIREEFAHCGRAGRQLAALSDAALAEIGLAAMHSDEFETAVHEALRTACEQLEAFDPEGDPGVEFRSS